MPSSPGQLLKLRDEFALTAANGFALLIQFVFQSVIVRMVAPGEFGLISSLLAIQGVLNIPIAIWQLAQARSLSSYSGSSKGFRRLALGQLWKIRHILLAGILIYLLIGPLMNVYIKETSWLVWLLVVTGCVCSVVESWGLACFQSRHAFLKLGLVSIGAAAARLGMIHLLLPGLSGVIAVLLSVLAGFMVPIVGIWIFFKMPGAEAQPSTPLLKLSILPASLSTIFTILWLNFDIIIARNRFEDTLVAGHYAVVAVLCKAVFWFASPISTVYLPRFVKAEIAGDGTARVLLTRAVALCAAICIGSIAGVWLLGDWLVRIFSGKTDVTMLAHWLKWAMVAKFPIVCVTPFLAYFVVRDSKRTLVVILALLLLVFLYAQTFATNVAALLSVLFGGGLVIFIACWIIAWDLGARKDLELDF